MLSEMTWCDPLPESVWQLLPGGPVARDGCSGEAWQYMCSVTHEGRVWHEFRHREHPAYEGARVNVQVVDTDAGPRLASLVVAGDQCLSDPDPAPPAVDDTPPF